MIEIKNKKDCCGCEACEQVCPKKCITMMSDNEGFLYPKVKTELCVHCDLCEKVCPIIKAESIVNFEKEAYAVKSIDNELVMNSSSGGIFSVFAEHILNDDGFVCGAAFDKDFHVKHKFISKPVELDELRRSKYVQSNIDNKYVGTKRKLESGKKVFFAGTPCQIAGLKNFLSKEYDNLFTQDIVCHGVPSPKLWDIYLQYICEKKGFSRTSINKINFRDKHYSWGLFSLCILANNKKVYRKTIQEDLYLTAFQKNISLRPSCYNCPFRGNHRFSDITVADFWGIEKTKHSLKDNKGTSLLIINTKKGKELLNSVDERIRCESSSISEALLNNRNYNKSAAYNPSRCNFYEDIYIQDFEMCVRKYCDFSKREEIKIRFKRIVKMLLNKC